MSRKIVLDLVAQRPLWCMPQWLPERMRAALDQDWEVCTVNAMTDSDGDGGPVSSEATELVRGAEVYVGFGISGAVIDVARDTLRWVHSAAAGASSAITALRDVDVVLTNSAGIHAEPMADWVLGSILHFTRGFDLVVRGQAERRWGKDAFTDGAREFPEVESLRVGIIGLGGVGSAVARRCMALGMEVRGVRRHPMRASPGVTEVLGLDRLPELAAESDVLVIAVPSTAETVGLVGPDVLQRLPEHAIVINVARGSVLDEAAVLAHLDTGRLRGVALDVFNTEPLAVDHPFWAHPNVLVSPHISAVTSRFWDRESSLLLANAERYVSGKELLNVVSFAEGY